MEVAVLCIPRMKGDVGVGVPDHVSLVLTCPGLLLIHSTGWGAALPLPTSDNWLYH